MLDRLPGGRKVTGSIVDCEAYNAGRYVDGVAVIVLRVGLQHDPLIEIRFEAPIPTNEFSNLPDVQNLQVDGTLLRCRLAGSADALVKAAARFTVLSIRSTEPSLEELFFTYYHREEARHVA